MIKVRDSLSRKLTAMNMLVSGGALLLASMAFFAYDLFTFRANMVTNTSIQAQIIGSNSVSPLIFNDVRVRRKYPFGPARVPAHCLCGNLYRQGRVLLRVTGATNRVHDPFAALCARAESTLLV